jgi:polygalacturonase
MKIIRLILSLIAAGSFCSSSPAASTSFNIRNEGAVPDGKTPNTAVLQRTIDRCHAAGGGRVLVPEGTFVTGGLQLKSNVELHLEKGAVLLGSTNPDDYSDNGYEPHAGPEIAGRPAWKALLFARNADNISLTGAGTVDGQGRVVAENIWVKLNPDTDKGSRRAHEKHRPQLIYFRECSNIAIRGITLKNSSCWVQTYEKCRDLVLQGLRVDSTVFWNNDGVDLIDSRKVTIQDCFIDSADDGICLKSHGVGDFCEDISISNCIVRSSASAFKLGTASRGGFRNIKIRNMHVYDTYRSAIALEAVDGGFLENIDIDGVTAHNTGNAIFIRRGQRHGTPAPVRNISIKNLIAYIPAHKPDLGYPTAGPSVRTPHNLMPSSITGLPGFPVENVVLENIQILHAGGGDKQKAFVEPGQVPEKPKDYPEFSMFGELPAWGLYVRHAKGITLKNVTFKALNPDFREMIVFDDVQDLEWKDKPEPKK